MPVCMHDKAHSHDVTVGGVVCHWAGYTMNTSV